MSDQLPLMLTQPARASCIIDDLQGTPESSVTGPALSGKTLWEAMDWPREQRGAPRVLSHCTAAARRRSELT